MKKVFIDGSEGTTGLRIYERFMNRDDIELLKITPELRKDPAERKKLINQSDITFLCLPDAAAIESVSLVENENVKIIDASTAHRTKEGWAYGFPELSDEFKNKIKEGKRIAVPGCYASGFNAIVYPLVKKGIIGNDYPVSSFAISGYSGAGKNMIAKYDDENRTDDYNAPRPYALTQQHKHLKEMKFISDLAEEPLFSPIIADYYAGMVVSIPLYASMLKEKMTLKDIHSFYAKYYEGKQFIKVMPFGIEEDLNGFLPANACAGWDGMEIFITGNDDRILISSRFDNLGKGASGAAIQCMNIMLDCEEDKGLNL
ncbi:MAG: N-acetyl-gamma-glutamyl-phosphate reductase [Clostridiales bacterium]|nr:N-acetyl-gamma-glutamyl-phosphate reductase [Clostridiales bacterium]